MLDSLRPQLTERVCKQDRARRPDAAGGRRANETDSGITGVVLVRTVKQIIGMVELDMADTIFVEDFFKNIYRVRFFCAGMAGSYPQTEKNQNKNRTIV